jgi:hypothetical protein
MTEQDANKQAVTELIEAIKTLGVQQAQMAELLRDVVTKALPALQAELSQIGNAMTRRFTASW